MQHPCAIARDMNDNTKDSANSTDNDNRSSEVLSASDLSARYRLVYDDICLFCAEMWANITSTRSRAVEHVIFSASLLGLYFAFDAALDSYRIRWLGLACILALIAGTFHHFRIVVGVIRVNESRLGMRHVTTPSGISKSLIIADKEKKADKLRKISLRIGHEFIRAKKFWYIGVALGTVLGVIEWFV